MKQLPKELWKYFWDIDASKLNVDKRKVYVVHRMIDWGHAKDMRFVIKYCGGTKMMSEILKKRRGLFMVKARFWSQILGIPDDQVESLKPEYHTTWKY